MSQKQYNITSDCSLRELGGKHLLMVFPSGSGRPYALDVNDSFASAFLFAKDAGSFTEEDLAGFLRREFGISEDIARKDAAATLELWLKYQIVSE